MRDWLIYLAVMALVLALVITVHADLIQMSWDAPKTDVLGNAITARDIRYYRIYRKSGASWTTVQYESGSTTTTILSQTVGTTSVYAVAAATLAGEGAKSEFYTNYLPKIAAAPTGITTNAP